ncbi:hypothetical protein C7M84_018100 [Penaeus vannamei]|uniref:Uncharacterized protein n=1 Tax=Penaeus vannamei TaxID=6689 RepID=A0A3R7SJS2_PENVA|nr:hypothetical protein C7M84_018100 [Penaeus vannamei]
MGVPLLLSARSLSQHDRKQGPLLRHAQGGDALRTPHHPRPGKRLALSRHARQGVGRGPRVDLPPPRGARPNQLDATPHHRPREEGPRPAPRASSPQQPSAEGGSPLQLSARALSPHDRGQGPLGPGATEGSPSDGPGSQARASPCPRKTRQTGQTDRQPAAEAVPLSLSAQALSHTRPRPGPTPPPSAREGARGRWGEARANPWPAALGPRGRGGRRGREKPKPSPGQPRKTWLNGLAGQAARPPTPLARSGQARRRHGGKDRAGDARPPPPPPHSRPRAALGSGGPRSHPRPLRHPRTPAPDRLSLQLAAQARSQHDQRQGLPSDRAGDARPPPPPHSRPRAALGSGGPRSHPRPLRHPRTPAPDRLSLQLAAQARSQHDQRQGLPSLAAQARSQHDQRQGLPSVRQEREPGGR